MATRTGGLVQVVDRESEALSSSIEAGLNEGQTVPPVEEVASIDSSFIPFTDADYRLESLSLRRRVELTMKPDKTRMEHAELAVIKRVEDYLTLNAPAVMIGSEFVRGEGKKFSSFDPSTGLPVYTGREASPDQVVSALDKAHEAFLGWSSLEWNERAVYLNRLAEVFERRKDELAVVLSMDTGRLLQETQTEIAGLGVKIKAAMNHEYKEKKMVGEGEYVQYEPIGTVAVIGPFNIPAGLINGPVVHALAMGNTVVVKFSELTPLIGHFYAECLAEAGFPEGVVSCVQGGREVGDALVDPDRIQGLFFTGSSEAGVAINTKLASRPDILVSLEMSGVNPMILDLNVSSDEILDKYVDLVVESSFYTTGQRCVNGRHLYCVGNEAQLSLFRDKMTQRLNRMKFGAWNDADLTDVVAPLICVQAARKVEEQAGELLARGRVWGEQPKFAVDSAYVPPIVVEVGKDFPAGKNIFGPVLIVTLASDVNEAVALANRSKQVISAGIYSEDSDFIEKAMKVKAGLRRVNRATTGANGKMPFGGVGLAGNHRPVGSDTMNQCCYSVATTVHKF